MSLKSLMAGVVVAGFTGAAIASPVVTLNFVDNPSPGYSRYKLHVAAGVGETDPNAFNIYTSATAVQSWAFGGFAPTPDLQFPAASPNLDTTFLFAPPHQVGGAGATELNDKTLNGVDLGFGATSIDGVARATPPGPSYDFFQIVVKDGIPATVFGNVAAPNFGNTPFNFEVGGAIPEPASLGLLAGGLILLAARRRSRSA